MEIFGKKLSPVLNVPIKRFARNKQQNSSFSIQSVLMARKRVKYSSVLQDEIAQWKRSQTLSLDQISDKCATQDFDGKGGGICLECRHRCTNACAYVPINFKSPESFHLFGKRCSVCNLKVKMVMSEAEFRGIVKIALERMVQCHHESSKPKKKKEKMSPRPPCELSEKCFYGPGPGCANKK